MDFDLHDDCERWFKDILEADGVLKFDVYYWCLMVGLAAGRATSYESSKVTGFIKHFPDEFKPRSRLLIGLLITEDLRDRVISLTDREAVHSALRRLVRSNSAHGMTDEGIRLMNQYAYGGYLVLRDRFAGERPRSLDVFLRQYHKCVRSVLADRHST